MTERKPRVFVATKGHCFARDAFEEMLRASAIEPTFVDHPAAAALMNPDGLRGYDALLLYDMPGLDFPVAPTERPAPVAPDPTFVAGFEALLAEGKGIVALHHSIAGWPGWPGYAEALGGAFLYRSALLRGQTRPSSGYAAGFRYEVVQQAVGHPVLKGVPERFVLQDEPYAFEIFEDSVQPLLARSEAIPADRFKSANEAVGGTDSETGWTAPVDVPLIAWAKVAGRSPLIYIQPGDTPRTYADPNYRTLVGNALRWVASRRAAAWAQDRPTSSTPAFTEEH